MSNKQPGQQRILVPSAKGLVRLCSFSCLTDHKGEGYFKASFPDLIGTQLEEVKITQPDPKSPSTFSTLKKPSVEAHEFSYHFEGGVSHFKGRRDRPTRFSVPPLPDGSGLHMFRLTIGTLASVKPFTKKASPADLILEPPFNRPRMIEFYLLKNVSQVIMHNARLDSVGPSTCRAIDLGNGLSLVVSDGEVRDVREDEGMSLFVFDDPTASFREPEYLK